MHIQPFTQANFKQSFGRFIPQQAEPVTNEQLDAKLDKIEERQQKVLNNLKDIKLQNYYFASYFLGQHLFKDPQLKKIQAIADKA